MKYDLDRYFLEMALKEAEIALESNTYPVGAVIVDEGNNIISRGRNQVYPNKDLTAHAEIDAIRNAEDKILHAKVRGEKLTIYSSLEPCPMCTGAILFAHIKKVVWLLNDDLGFGGYRKMKGTLIFEDRFKKVEMIPEPFKDLMERQIYLLERWAENPNHIENLRKIVQKGGI
ncbi:nucleoside deaminase [Heyndrickxia acidicola]|uniref:Nucleoside deaminase n=1 Tax=Heyndrickxia acidicola TaxID=209389 RepID=A0ABU6MNM7_9BACI|nr:nucleoside deaminase [Heyndrickxia acidicola]MED1205934.1 nucleoside deaminase [Heyndrickxia acidicola]